MVENEVRVVSKVNFLRFDYLLSFEFIFVSDRLLNSFK